MTSYPAPGAVTILRGDERLSKSHSAIGPRQWFCQLHGHQKAVYVLSNGETYPACQECIWTAPTIALGEAEEIP